MITIAVKEYPFCIKNVVTLVFNPSAESQVGADRDNGVQKKLIRFRQMAVGDTDCYSQKPGPKEPRLDLIQ